MIFQGGADPLPPPPPPSGTAHDMITRSLAYFNQSGFVGNVHFRVPALVNYQTVHSNQICGCQNISKSKPGGGRGGGGGG